MDYTDENKRAIDAYETLTNKCYKEPVDREYEDGTTAILEGIKSDTEESEMDTKDSWCIIVSILLVFIVNW